MDLLLRRRSVGEPELMDDPACDPVALDNTYRLFGVINPLVASWRPVYRRHLRPALRAAARQGRPATVLDLSLIHISEPTRRLRGSRMPSSA